MTQLLGHMLVVYTVRCAFWNNYSTSSFNVDRVACNNVYRALMGIKRVYGHSISIDGFEAT